MFSFASNSVFSISKAALTMAILAFSMLPGHARVSYLLVQHEAHDELGVLQGASGLLLYLDVAEVDLVCRARLLGHLGGGRDYELGELLRFAGDQLRLHAGPCDLDQPLLVGRGDFLRELSQELDRLAGCLVVALDDHGRMDALVDELLSLLEERSGEYDRRGRPVAHLVVGGLRDLDEHLRRGVLDVDLLEHGRPVVGDGDVAERVYQHLVHAAGTHRGLHDLRDQLSCRDVVPLCLLTLRLVAPFFQDENGGAPRSHCGNSCC